MRGEDMSGGERTARSWQVEVVVAALLAAVALLVIGDSLRVGMSWKPEGPEAGFFPFYVGVILLAAAAWTLVAALLPAWRDESNFVDRSALRSVLAVLLPSIAFVAAAKWIGLYVAAAALILFFMRVYGRHRILTCVGVALGVPVAVFALFEIWFLVPLPKGPLEAALGY